MGSIRGINVYFELILYYQNIIFLKQIPVLFNSIIKIIKAVVQTCISLNNCLYIINSEFNVY